MKEALLDLHKDHWTPSFNCDCGECWKHQEPDSCMLCVSQVALILEPRLPSVHTISKPFAFLMNGDSRSVLFEMAENFIVSFDDVPGNMPRWILGSWEDPDQARKSVNNMIDEGWDLLETTERNCFYCKKLIFHLEREIMTEYAVAGKSYAHIKCQNEGRQPCISNCPNHQHLMRKD